MGLCTHTNHKNTFSDTVIRQKIQTIYKPIQTDTKVYKPMQMNAKAYKPKRGKS